MITIKRLSGVLLLGISVFLLSPAHSRPEEVEESIRLEQVPKNVMAAAKAKLEGFEPQAAEKEPSRKYIEYELKGTANGKKYEIEVKVDKAGRIIKVEVEEDDDAEDEDEDEDGDEDDN